MWKGETLAGRAVWSQGERLYDAVDKLRVEDVKRILGAGMDPNSDEQRGHGDEQWTPLHRASAHGSVELVDALLRAGADPNAFNQRQSTPLHLAAWSGHTLAVRQLLMGGADPAIKTNRNETSREVAVKMQHTDVMRAIDEHYAFIKARVNADHSRAKEDADRKRALNSACRLAKESLAKGDAPWAIQIIERGLLNDAEHPELLELLHKAEVQQLAERTFAAEEKAKLTEERLAEVEARLERAQDKIRTQTSAAEELEESARSAAHAAKQASLQEERTRIALEAAEQQVAALTLDRSEGRVKVQARWGERGQWISFKTTRDIELGTLQVKLAGALHVSVEELRTMNFQWRDQAHKWWRIVDDTDVTEALAPMALAAAEAASGALSEKELMDVVRSNKADKPVLLQFLPAEIQPDQVAILEARVVELQAQVDALRSARPGSASRQKQQALLSLTSGGAGDAAEPATEGGGGTAGRTAVFSQPLYEQVAAATHIQKIVRGRLIRHKMTAEG
jgi:hypothetical protein